MESNIFRYAKPSTRAGVRSFHIHNITAYDELSLRAKEERVSMSNVVSNLIEDAIVQLDEAQRTLDDTIKPPFFASMQNKDLLEWLNQASSEEAQAFDKWINESIKVYNKWCEKNWNKVRP